MNLGSLEYSAEVALYEVNMSLVQKTREIVKETTADLLARSIGLLEGKGKHIDTFA